MKAHIWLLYATSISAPVNIANAALIDGITGTTDYEVININPDDTVTGYIEFFNGIINNQGLVDANSSSGTWLQGKTNSTVTLNNDGNIYFQSSITGGKLTINNSTSGQIVFTDYFDAYQTTTIENAGTIFIANGLGDGATGSWVPFTYEYAGLINNTGKFLIRRKNSPDSTDGGNVCYQGNKILTFQNAGYLEIANGSLCDFGTKTPSQYLKASFVQNSGEIRVDGVFGAHDLTFNKGLVSGTGIIQGYFKDSPLPNGVTISPGSSQASGTLTLIPDEGYLICVECSIQINLSETQNNNRLHVAANSGLYMNNYKLNVELRDGYIPPQGTSFTVVSADNIIFYGLAPTYNLPKLPGNRSWSVQNTGTEIILTAN